MTVARVPKLGECSIGVIGLGYVGLPLAVEFGRRHVTVGFDISEARVGELQGSIDRTGEVDADDLAQARLLRYTADPSELRDCEVYVVTVPTPIDEHKRPELGPILEASRTVGRMVSRGDIVIYESTVYPGATEEVCVPVLEAESGLVYNEDFFVGYSPERINPGDKQHRLTSIRKVTSGSTEEVAEFVDELYGSIISAGTHRTRSIRVAEAAKVIENTQRDVNIALINELAILFDRLGLDTLEVLEAAGTKWNFLPFRPGLVGGHCIGVDPYYLTYKAMEIGYEPEVILAGRRINDAMGAHVAQRVIKLMARRRIHVAGANILVLGLTFKENCPDLRNTRVTDIVEELKEYNARVSVYDPRVDRSEALREYGIEPIEELAPADYDAIVLAVAHDEFRSMGIDKVRALGRKDVVVFDVKGVFPADTVDGRL